MQGGIFDNGVATSVPADGLTFGAAVELAVAMPLSWLPLISDYTREAEKPIKATAASAIVYGIVSCWMYIIGMGAAIFAQNAGIDQIMLKAGLGIAGLLIIVFQQLQQHIWMHIQQVFQVKQSLAKLTESIWRLQ